MNNRLNHLAAIATILALLIALLALIRDVFDIRFNPSSPPPTAILSPPQSITASSTTENNIENTPTLPSSDLKESLTQSSSNNDEKDNQKSFFESGIFGFINEYNENHQKKYNEMVPFGYTQFDLAKWAYDDSNIHLWYGLGFVLFVLRFCCAIILALLEFLPGAALAMAGGIGATFGVTARNVYLAFLSFITITIAFVLLSRPFVKFTLICGGIFITTIFLVFLINIFEVFLLNSLGH
ncbi:hypothetical protein EYB53_023965 [Candidatus Chloroploca sp. M-50]|uniref:Uncharacterized protein n=1 Tax=Candidatus Chloroploca mongolica TaxID=2528176 RepID=A0ABS4DH91_9CHLR|nr:hypothetical protein [Candidatus Chloroploca mongolica]MBP1468788.1 hypothetical protein [Candidatus Chloroploca mongolica]